MGEYLLFVLWELVFLLWYVGMWYVKVLWLMLERSCKGGVEGFNNNILF